MQQTVRENHEQANALDGVIERVRSSQQNVLPSDQLRNGASVDDAFWNGFEKPRGIQRAGLLAYSAAMLLVALGLIGLGHDEHQPLIYVFAFIPGAIAIKVGINAFRPRKKKRLID